MPPESGIPNPANLQFTFHARKCDGGARDSSEREDMKLHVDKGTDALHLRLDDSTIVGSEEVSPGIVLDYSESGEVVGVEVLHLSRRSSRMKLSTLEFETT